MMDAEFGLTALLALAMAELQSKGLNCHQMVSSRRNNKANVGKIRLLSGFKPFNNEKICTNYIKLTIKNTLLEFTN